ncbi:glucose-6-phosphatase 2-like [Gigantopelta aegis]|uniref:glucose-6-phosphatase 2-like n=1 Tax=Gigantopelta aegis TaxID=1735272 RepID=UPI001B889334|nr:glucose-6-phosphatase 2-like [Gigantopelta aegis]
MDEIHAGGIIFIQHLQQHFKGFSEYMLFLSHLGDPRNAFLVYFPIAYFIHHSVGKRVVLVAAISEWLNAIFKWLLHGERPYWWVQESNMYKEPPHLQQYRLTCETGPGSPSGHAMVTSSVLFLLVSEFIYYGKITRQRNFILLVEVNIVLCDESVAGILLAVAFNSISTTSLSLKHYAMVSAMILISTVAAYYIILLLGFDPVWSVSVATKWCARPEWIHLDTTLFYAMVRDCSCLLGMGLGLHLSGEDNSEWTPFSKLLLIIFSLAAAQVEERIVISHHSQIVFYLLASVKYIVLFVVIVSIIPKIGAACNLVGYKKKDKLKKT